MRAADDFTVLDWDEMKIDSVLPIYSEVVPLESNYRLYDYVVSVLYPEWSDLTVAETQVAQRFDALIYEQLDIHSSVSVSRKVGMLDINFYPIVRRDGGYKKLLSGKIVITPVAKTGGRLRAQISSSDATSERYTRESVLASGKWVKISVTEDGIYSLSKSALSRMGFSDMNKVHVYGYGGYRLSEVSDPDSEWDDLHEVPLYKRDSDLLFWANGLVYWDDDTRVFNPYANAACYFVTESEESNSATAEAAYDGTPSATYTSFPDHVLYEQDQYAWFSGGRNLYESTNYANSQSHTYRLTAPGYEGDGRLTVAFSAGGSTSTSVTPTVNGTSLTSISMAALGDYTYGVVGTRTYSVDSYSQTDNTTWTIGLTTSNTNDARLDYLALHYTRSLTPNDGFVAFSQTTEGAAQFDISGSSLAVMRIPSATRDGAILEGTQSGSTYCIAVDDATERYVAFETGYSFPAPTIVGSIENQNLHALDSIDMVIIVPENDKLTEQAERLAEAHREYDGLSVAVVRADQIYNEFSSGTPDATAYRRLMKMLYDRAESDDVAPKYLLLFGDCAWDNRMISSAWSSYSPEDYLLCFESENSLSDVYCYVMEDYFGLLDDGEGSTLTSDKVDIGVGRFPVTSEAEAKLMVDKSIAHLANTYAGNWKNIISFIGDDGDDNLHMEYCDDVAERVIAQNPEMEVQKVMFDAYTRVSTPTHNSYPDVNELLTEQVNSGALVMNYTGHAATYTLSHEFVLLLEDFSGFSGTNLPLWVTAACDVMPFDGQSSNIGETAVLNDYGAAVAFYGTTRTVYAYNNLQMNRWFMTYLLDTNSAGERYRIGDAIRLAKTRMISGNLETSNRQNKLHYALLGDPALTFGAPTNRVVLDSINGKDASESQQLSAGQIVTMKGHLEDNQESVLTDFNGILSARVYDNLETITCLNNASASSAFTFTNRDKVLFNGQDSIRSGQFQLQFVMPSDLNYSNETGRVVFYAINNDLTVEANGYCESFTVGGVSENSDTLGPEIQMYLNTESFENGDKVNSTPCFFASLQDESGISYSGNGLGHNLTLVIDQDADLTYNLNDYYTAEFGDYTLGTVVYSIPELEDGAHSLTFRAWDVLNNTSSQSLDFVVDSSLKPTLLSVTTSVNPATTSTTFLISHDRMGSECDILIEVFNMAGQRMWCHEETQTSTSGVSSVSWNLSNNSGGRLYAGVYVYRVTLRSGDSKEVSKSEKLIISGNN